MIFVAAVLFLLAISGCLKAIPKLLRVALPLTGMFILLAASITAVETIREYCDPLTTVVILVVAALAIWGLIRVLKSAFRSVALWYRRTFFKPKYVSPWG